MTPTAEEGHNEVAENISESIAFAPMARELRAQQLRRSERLGTNLVPQEDQKRPYYSANRFYFYDAYFNNLISETETINQ